MARARFIREPPWAPPGQECRTTEKGLYVSYAQQLTRSGEGLLSSLICAGHTCQAGTTQDLSLRARRFPSDADGDVTGTFRSSYGLSLLHQLVRLALGGCCSQLLFMVREAVQPSLIETTLPSLTTSRGEGLTVSDESIGWSVRLIADSITCSHLCDDAPKPSGVSTGRRRDHQTRSDRMSARATVR